MASLADRVLCLMLAAYAGVGALSATGDEPARPSPVSATISVQADETARVRYALREPIMALHYERELDGYRSQLWTPSDPAFRWVPEGEGERLERIDGERFSRVELSIPIDYRALPKSYAPFSPFSQGDTLLHSGQFHVCLSGLCQDPLPLAITVLADGLTVGVHGRRTPNSATFISRDSGTNVFVGKLSPVDADGFIAVIDPGLPDRTHAHLENSLPQAMRYFEAFYGKLPFKPELYVSIDSRPAPGGRKSTQGGTLPNQIFMHFDGEDAEGRVRERDPRSLDWFFAHEAAHLFQRDGTGQRGFDDKAAWIHEGGAEAMAALAIARRGDEEQAYSVERVQQAHTACEAGLADTTMDRASAEGRFHLHYQCGLLLWLALDELLHGASEKSLHDLNSLYFERVLGGQAWSAEMFLDTANQLGADTELLCTVRNLVNGKHDNPSVPLKRFASLAERSVKRHSPSRE
ncbi:MAG: hypothetical protein AAFY29_00675 [Pseudomonadota bacterium]